MDEKLRDDIPEMTEEKPDISHIPNSMFDQNTATFNEGETMNRDYLHQIYGESMDFLNKEVRLTRTKHYEMREKVEENFNDSVKHEKKKFAIILVVYVVLMAFAIFSIAISIEFFQGFVIVDSQKYFADVKYNPRSLWGAGGFFFGVGWIIFTISTGVFGAFVYSTIKNVKQYKEKKIRALKILEENKYEQMLLGLYDAGR